MRYSQCRWNIPNRSIICFPNPHTMRLLDNLTSSIGYSDDSSPYCHIELFLGYEHLVAKINVCVALITK